VGGRNLIENMKYISPLILSLGLLLVHIYSSACTSYYTIRGENGRIWQTAFQFSESRTLPRTKILKKHNIVQLSSRIPCWSKTKPLDEEKEIGSKVNTNTKICCGQKKICIRFSRAFQLHVVFQTDKGRLFDYHDDEVLESFSFLDEALEKYPHAELLKLTDIGVTNDNTDFELILAGMGIIPSIAMMTTSSHNASDKKDENISADSHIESGFISDGKGYESLKYLTSLVLSGHKHQMSRFRENFMHMLENNISMRRFAAHTPESIRYNYENTIGILTRGKNYGISPMEVSNGASSNFLPIGLGFTEAGAKTLIIDFPQLCLYETHELEERIRLMISPFGLQKDHNGEYHYQLESRHEDHVDLFKKMRMGFGAGLSIDQATKAIRAVPQLLAIYHEDARKPPALYFYNTLQVPSNSVDGARRELSTKYLAGCTSSDVFTFGYLHSLGVEWNQIKLLLDAFPTLTFCDQEPGWELLDYGPVRSELKESTLHFLRKRLQVHNADLYAMLKTHSRLSTYNAQNNILPTMNALQSRLGLSSRDLRRIILRMPSLLGMNVDRTNSMSTLDEKIKFFKDEAQMNASELKGAILKQPSILQYSLEASLRPKIRFLVDDLSIPETAISRIIYTAPAILGLSLEYNLRPTAAFIIKRCGISSEQLGLIIISIPSILSRSLIGKIEPCISFLSTGLMLGTNPVDLKALILNTPRILLQSVELSLAPKLQMISEAIDDESKIEGKFLSEIQLAKAVASILSTNPALLVTTNSILHARLKKYQEQPYLSLEEALRPCKVGRKRIFSIDIDRKVPTQRPCSPRKQRSVVETSCDGTAILNVFSNVQEAAMELKVSASSVYAACGKNRQLRGRTLKYSNDDSTDIDIFDNSKVRRTEQIANEIKWTDKVNVTRLNLYDREIKLPKVSIIAFVSGGIHPSDNINDTRGRRRAGGLALHFPQVKLGRSNLVDKFRLSTKQSFGMIMPEETGGSNASEGVVLVGFPFLRPSRNRCDLYACHGAIKVVLQLLKQSATEKDMQNIDVDVEICSDSSYVCNLLNDPQSVLRWGSAPTIEEFEFDGYCPQNLANPDLLYPLAKTMRRIVTSDVADKRGTKLCLGKNINIIFRHSANVLSDKITDGYITKLNSCAKKTACWQFNKG